MMTNPKRCSRLSGLLPVSYLYLILSRSGDPVVYAGMTPRPLKYRLAEHNDTTSKGYTAKRGPWCLLACRAFLSADCALIAEKQLKKSRYDKTNWIRRTGRLRTLCERHGIQHPLLRNHPR